MTLHVGSNKIKDTGAYGVYFCPGKTNCLIYTPKNINLTLSNGTLTLKAGSKVYVPNGKNTDGSNRFDEVVIENDKTVSAVSGGDAPCVIFYNNDNGTLYYEATTKVYSGTESTTDGTYYHTNTNIIDRTTNTPITNVSLPLCLCSRTSSVITSIDQVFNWCGYISSTAFVLPGVKGLIPNGFNANGTYKVIEFETDKVLTYGRDLSQTDVPLWIRPDFSMVFSKGIEHNKDINHIVTSSTGELNVDAVAILSADLTSGVITSLTPYTTQPSTTVIPVKEIYNGSQLVYQYKQPGEVLFEKSTAGTYTFTAPYNATVDVVLVGGGGGGTTSWGGYAKTGGSAGMIKGSIAITKGTKYTIVVGGAGASDYGTSITDAAQGGTGGTSSAFGNSAYGGEGSYTHVGYGSTIARDGEGGSFRVVSGFTGSNGTKASTTNRYGNYGGGGYSNTTAAKGGYVLIKVKG